MSVCGTGAARVELSGFSREHGYARCPDPPKGDRYSHFNGDFRRPAALSLLLHRIAPYGSDGMLTVMPSPSPFGLGLGPD